MKAQRSGMTRRALAALTALPLAFAMSACRIGLGAEGSNGRNASGTAPASSASNGAASPQSGFSRQSGSSPQATGASKSRPSQVQGAWEGSIDGDSYRVDVNSVVVKDGVTTLTVTFTNTGSTTIYGWYLAFGGSDMLTDKVKLTDVQNNLVYSPGKGADGSCMCSEVDSAAMASGESRTVFTTFKGLPDGVNAVTVSVSNVAPFEGIPVTRE